MKKIPILFVLLGFLCISICANAEEKDHLSGYSLQIKEISFPIFIISRKSIVQSEKIIFAAGPEYDRLNIYLVDFKDNQTPTIAEPGSWEPILSPDRKTIAYNQLDLDKLDAQNRTYPNDVYVMNWNGSNKKRLTFKGRHLIQGWSDDGNTLYLCTGGIIESGIWPAWDCNGKDYWSIKKDGSNLKKIASLPKKEKEVEVKTLTIGGNKEIKRHDIYFKNKKVYSTPNFLTETETAWEAEALKLNGGNILVIEFKPLQGKKAPFYSHDGKCNLVLANAENPRENRLIAQDIGCFSPLSVSPNKQFIIYHGGKDFYLATSNFKTKIRIGLGFCDVAWSRDSKSFCVESGRNLEQKLHWINIIKK